MCDTCGCGDNNGFVLIKPSENDSQIHIRTHTHPDHTHPHTHDHDHEHDHEHSHDTSQQGRLISVEKDVLHTNNLLAERNRGFFEAKNILAVNLVSSPGSGKTMLLEKTIQSERLIDKVFVIEGDQQSTQDADRIDATGVPVIQVNTGSGCHLDAAMINSAVKELQIHDNSVLMIENVGNLVCPAMFDLGEKYRVVIISVTEGEDKPLKYPYMFQTADICIINKTDLLPYLDFDIEKLKEYALKVNHHLEFIQLSAKTGEGFDTWLNWLEQKLTPVTA